VALDWTGWLRLKVKKKSKVDRDSNILIQKPISAKPLNTIAIKVIELMKGPIATSNSETP
jgi:hypothetical protein